LQYNEVLKFWFEELNPKDQFAKNDQIDQTIRDRFLFTLEKALHGELFSWRETGLGRWAEIIVLDQFSRNIFRDSPRAFAGDPIALTLAQEAVHLRIDQTLEARQRAFLYMPYMHSESTLIHEIALKLFDQPGLEENLRFEKLHKKIIDQFGRFPHRNRLLGRISTAEETEFLKTPGSSF
jgi:uncharacterized protein (DUF924 family)